jgi:hypothetical protein
MEIVAKMFSLPGTFLMFKISLPTLVLLYILFSLLGYKIQKSFELKWLK